MISILFAAALTAGTLKSSIGPLVQCQYPLGCSTTVIPTLPVSSSPLVSLVRTVGIHGYRCINHGGKGGVVRWYDGTREAWTIILPGGPRSGSQSEFPMPVRLNDFHAKADKGINCTLSFPMDAP